MATWAVAFPARTQYALVLTVDEISTDPANNQSTVSFNLYIDPPSPAGGAYDLGTSSSYSVTIDGATYTGNYSYDFRYSTSNLSLRSGTKVVTHDTNGSKTISVAASTSAASPLGSANIGSQTAGLTDFTRVPTTPGTPSLSRSGSTITASTSGSTFYGSSANYQWYYSVSGGAWVYAGNPGSSLSFNCGSTTGTCAVFVRAADSEGYTDSAQASIIGVPSAPATIVTSRTGRNVTVTAGNATGTGIDNYYAQYSTDNGSTWSTAVTMTSQVYTYTALTPALTYLFRVYAHNSIGNSAYTTTPTGTFVPAGGNRWNGTAWAPTSIAKRWNGSAWVDITIAKRWNGSAWVDLS